MTLVLEPPDFPELAQHLRDATWLDMRVVDVGTCERVRINQLNIGRERDEIVVEQQWWDEVIGDDEIHVETITRTFDAEDVRWLRETQVEISDVKPMELAEKTVVAASPQHLVAEIIRTVAYLTEGVSEQDLRSGTKQTGCIRPRQEAMWLAYAMTDLPPSDICTLHFGYASQQPLLTVNQKLNYAQQQGAPVHYNEPLGAWLHRVKTTMRLIDSHYGHRYRRQGGPWKTWL